MFTYFIYDKIVNLNDEREDFDESFTSITHNCLLGSSSICFKSELIEEPSFPGERLYRLIKHPTQDLSIFNGLFSLVQVINFISTTSEIVVLRSTQDVCDFYLRNGRSILSSFLSSSINRELLNIIPERDLNR